MKNDSKKQYKSTEACGETVNQTDELTIGGCSSVELASIYGTPTHIVDEALLFKNSVHFREVLASVYPGVSKVHYAFKCNPVPGVLSAIKRAGLYAEVMSLFELQLAIKLGYKGREIVVNGPYKTAEFLENCVAARTYLIIVDSLFELENLSHICDRLNTRADILLRINPDYVPSGMNQGSSTASRKGSPLGLDPKSGEIGKALQNLREYRYVNFRGIHFHIGTGIQDPSDYAGALKKLSGVVKTIRQSKFQIQIIDTGGGFGISSSREMTSFELIRYQATGQLPPWKHKGKNLEPEEFFKQITAGITKLFPMGSTPELIVEPGRIITGASQCLLIRVHQVKKRDGLPDWVITNGGVGTVTMPTYYEYHRVSLCNEFNRKTTKKVTLTGPGCFAADVVYRNIRMPELKPGEIIAIMDTGAYFTSWESNFSHPLPAIVAVNNGNHRLIRRRQDFEDMIARDVFEQATSALESKKIFQ